jgi:hypothetical protein
VPGTPSPYTIDSDLYGSAITILSLILLVLPIIGTAAAWFLWRVYRSDLARPRSWVLFNLAVGATVVDISSIAIAYIAVRRFLGSGPFPEGLLILGIVIVVLEFVPIWYALNVWNRRRLLAKASFPDESGVDSIDDN